MRTKAVNLKGEGGWFEATARDLGTRSAKRRDVRNAIGSGISGMLGKDVQRFSKLRGGP